MSTKNKNVIVIKLTIPAELWDKLMQKYPQYSNEPKATAIRLILKSLI